MKADELIIVVTHTSTIILLPIFFIKIEKNEDTTPTQLAAVKVVIYAKNI